MKSSIGSYITLSLFGESHGPYIGIVMDGLPAGIPIDFSFIYQQMQKRRALNSLSTQRREEDQIQIISGLFNGYTTGSPLTIVIENTKQNANDYVELSQIYRPSHADYTADIKYKGYQDVRGGGHFSGRLTAPIVAAGAIAMQLLSDSNIKISTHILQCQEFVDTTYAIYDDITLNKQLELLNNKDFPVIDDTIEQKIKQRIQEVAKQGDSVGAILESVICNVPAGLGDPFFHSVESVLAHYLYSIPAVKGISFGLGFDFAKYCGSEVNDSFSTKDNKVITKTNHNGGINGGISNGMPIQLKTCIKPTPSIYKTQTTIQKNTLESTQLQIKGRHDPAIFHRAAVVIDSMLALAILEIYANTVPLANLIHHRKGDKL